MSGASDGRPDHAGQEEFLYPLSEPAWGHWPADEPEAAGQRAAVPPVQPVALLADDDVPVRTFIRELLTLWGFRVIVGGDGHEALRATALEPRLDVLVTDLVIQGLSGRELCTLLRRHLPDLPVVFMSRGLFDAVLDDGVPPRNAAFLAKPFYASELSDALQQLLAGWQVPPADGAGPGSMVP